MKKNSLAEALVEFRAANGMTQKDLAEKLNVSDKAVSRWENGKNYPDIETLQRLSELLGVTINNLLNGNLEVVEKKPPYRKAIVYAVVIALLIYIFPFYNWFAVSTTNFYGAREASYLLFRGWPSDYLQIQDILRTAEDAFSELGISKEEAKRKYGELGRYCITDDYDNVVKEKHKWNVLSVILNTYTAEDLGYIWIRYDQEGLDKDGEVCTGSRRIEALWCLEKRDNGEWYVSDVKEGP